MSVSVNLHTPLLVQAVLQQLDTAKTVGALLSQLSELPPKHLQLWWYSQDPSDQPGPTTSHAAAAAQWLQRCCSALDPAVAGPLPGISPGEDPVGSLAVWIMRALAALSTGSTQQDQERRAGVGSRPQLRSDRRQQQAHQQSSAGFGQQGGLSGLGEGAGLQQHPAEALMSLMDCLMTALQYHHSLHLQE
jgi:hypothetical protein